MTRVLLVQTPFFSSRRPNLGLSLLRAVLLRAGFACDLRYANLEFERLITSDVYRPISEEEPSQLLFGDLVFVEALWGRPPPAEELRRTAQELEGELNRGRVQREWLYDQFYDLSARALVFTQTLASEIAAAGYDLVGMGTMFQSAPALALARALKKHNNAPQIILGGSQCEGEMGLAMHERFPWIDYVARGEGEMLLVQLCRHLNGDDIPLHRIQGLVRREAGLSIACGDRGASPILDRLPTPEFDDWIEQRRSDDGGLPPDAMLPIETSRGCWYGAKVHCTFCGLNGEDLRYRRKSPDRALRDFRHVMAYGVPSINATDNILDMRYFEELLPELAKLRHDCTIFYEVKANLKERHLALLAGAGVRWIQPGIESLSTHVLRLMRKGVSAHQNVKLLKLAAEYHIGVAWNILYGFPGETATDYKDAADLIESIVHLAPPLFTCNRVRVDRFSPMFESPATFGIRGVKPMPLYQYVFPFPFSDIGRLAYYFDHVPDPRLIDESEQGELYAYIDPLRDAVSEWHRLTGKVAFISLRHEGRTILYDTRPVATVRTTILDHVDAVALEAVHTGGTRADVARRTGLKMEDVDDLVASHLERRWMIELDGRLLALSVPMDAHVPQGLSPVVAGPFATVLYTERMRGPREAVANDLGLEVTSG
jgi:ribosomal peptide maturation radical SAM protein 1